MRIRKAIELAEPARIGEMVLAVRAGEETATRLGVPVGTITEGRRVRMNLDTGVQITELGEDILTAEETIALVGGN